VASNPAAIRPATLVDSCVLLDVITGDEQWADFLYWRENSKGVHAERWRHTHGCGRFFNALRDTTNDHFLATYRVGERPPGTRS